TRVPSRRVRHAGRRGARVPVGCGRPDRASGQLRPAPLGPDAGRRVSRGRQRVRGVRARQQRLGMDLDGVRTAARLPGVRVLSGLLGELLRRPSLRDEGRLVAHGGVHAAAHVPQLVPAALSLRLHEVPHRRAVAMILLTEPRIGAGAPSFADEVRAGLARPGQKELPSKYLYDAVGSALFETICLLPEYGLARAGSRVLLRHAEDIVRRIEGPVLLAELGSGRPRHTRWLVEALLRRQPLTYYPIDISRAAL